MNLRKHLLLALTLSLLAALTARGATNVVTSAADNGGAGTLRTTISNATSGATIIFTNTLSGATITLTNGELLLDKNLNIDASALPNGIAISGNNSSRVFQVASNTTVVLNSLTISNGYAQGSYPGYLGAGIYSQGSLTLNRCTLAGNVAAGGGGGIMNWEGTLTVNQCTLTGNTANGGGAIGTVRGLFLKVDQCTLSGNTTTGVYPDGLGGDIFNYVTAQTNLNSIASDVFINQGGLVLVGGNIIQTYGEYGNPTPVNPAPITNSPLLAPLGNYGGPTPTMPPLVGSPAIDACLNGTSFGTDQRGFPRIVGPFADIGAVEYPIAPPIYSQDFDTDSTPNWIVNYGWADTTPTDNGRADFFFDYSTLGIPSAPHSGGATTRGMKLMADVNPANQLGQVTGAGISVSPLDYYRTNGDFELHMDLWINYNGATGGDTNVGSGQTIIYGAGYGTAGTSAQLAGNADSIFAGTSTATGTSANYRMYAPNKLAGYQNGDFQLSGNPVSGYLYNNPTGTRSRLGFTNFFGAAGTPCPPAQTNLYPQQTGLTCAPGLIDFAWHDLEIRKVGALTSYLIDGYLIASAQASDAGTPAGGYLAFLAFDIDGNASTDVNFTNLNFAIFDNVRVVALLAPSISSQPVSRTDTVGATAVFNVAAEGSTPLAYQWRRNGSDLVSGGRISGATANQLIIANVQLSDAGNYSAVITNAAGSVTSSDAVLTVTIPYTFTTMAGSAGQGGSDDGTGSAARFSVPIGVAVDSAGNVYVADQGNYTIRKMTPAGVVTTLAGSAGLSGSDDGTGSAARFSLPHGVAVDSAGNVYVADTYNHTIRKITSAGVVTTLAGSAGQNGSNDGTGSAARFYYPEGVAVDDAGNVYVADYANSTIRKITPAGTVTTLAGVAGISGSDDGTGSAARFFAPAGVAVDSAGNVYVADTYNHTIRKITSAGAVATLAGSAGQTGSADGIGSAARFNQPRGMAVDNAGNVYVTDANNNTIRKLTPVGTNWRVTTLAGSAGQSGSADGTGTAARFSLPIGLAVDSAGNLYVADTLNNTIRKGSPAVSGLTYEPSLGTLPENQGFARFAYGFPANPTVSGGVLDQNTAGDFQNEEFWSAISSNPFDFSTGFILEANLYVISSSYNSDIGGGLRRAGYELRAVDNTGRYLSINITSGGLWLDTSGTNSAPPGGGTFFTPFDATSGFNNYRLVAQGGMATLFINGTEFLSTLLGPVVDLVNTNIVSFGDNTTAAGSQTQLAWLRARPAVPPAIAVGPQSQSVVSGTSVTFSVVGAGNGPFTYQWTFNDTNLVAQTSASLFLPNVQLTNAGTYCVVVRDVWNVAITGCASLTVLAPPGITSQPQSQTVSSGTNVTFSVGATGSGPLLYQWRYNGANILGATNSTYTILNVQPSDGGVFSVLVQNPAGVVVSLDATLKVLSPALAFADNFGDRGTLSGLSGVGSGNNTNATREVGEPNHAGKFGNHSVWLEWTAPGSGVATFNTRGSSCDTLLALYTGTSFSNLVARASDDDSGGFFTSKAVVNVTNGIQYIIAIDGLGSASGDLVLSWNLVTNTPAIPVITQHPLDVTVTNGGSATFSITTASPNVTYQWYFNQSLVLTGATSATLVIPNVVRSNVGFYTVAVTGTNSQTIRSLAGSLEIGTEVATHTFDKLVDLFQAFQTNGGGNFAGSWKKGGGGTPASLSFPSVAAGSLGSQVINNFGATTDQGEPILTNVIGGNSRWYLLTAATNGTMVVDTAGSEINTQLKVYTGSNILSMALVAGDNHGSNSLVSFAAGAGTNYLIGVDGVTNNVGVVNINWRLGTPPAGGGYVGSQAYKLGDTLMLQAGDPGALPDPTYQWRLNDANLQGATSATYTRTNLQYNHGGVYSVVVSNFVGVVTNVIATVSVQSPLLLVLDGSSGVPKSRLSATATQARVLQLSTNLTQWTPLYTNADPSVPVVYLDPNSAARTKGFYRLLPWP